MTSPLFSFDVPGLPVAKGRARSRIAKGKGGKSFVAHYTPAETRNFEAMVKDLAVVARNRARRVDWTMPGSLEAGPLRMELTFRFPVPDSWPKWKREAALEDGVMHTKKPDGSNLAKAIEDACNAVLWKDDGQVVDLLVRKRFSRVPGVQVDVYRLRGVGVDATQAEHAAAMAGGGVR